MTLRVVHARPLWQTLLLRLFMLLLIALIATGLYWYGHFQGGHRHQESQHKQRQLEGQVAGLVVDNNRLREQNAILTRSAKVDHEAYNQLEVTVTRLHNELMDLKRELDFYRGIISPSDTSRGLDIQRFEIMAQPKGHFQYHLVLTQLLDNSEFAEGEVEFLVEGSQNGETVEYTLAQLSEAEGELAFRYQYFQSFEGELLLPDGFVPKRISLNVKPKGKTHKPFSQSYDWVVRES